MPSSDPAPALWDAEQHGDEAPGTGRLFHADNLRVMRHLASERTSGRCTGFSLIYIDPPYAMQANHGVRIGSEDAVAYSDCWTDAGYCQFMFERLVLIRALLNDDGAVFVHCDWRANGWLRLLLDEVFGRACFRNEVVWRRAPNLGRQAHGKQLGRCVDSIFVYSKTPGADLRGVAPVKSTAVALTPAGKPRGARWDPDVGEWFTLAPRGDYTDASIRELARAGRVHVSPTGKEYIKYWLRTGNDGVVYKDAPVDTVWDDQGVLPLRFATKRELKIGYVTQKPEALLERIIRWATREGDLVGDFFAGSGTTLAAAQKLGRAWIGCDSGTLAVHTIRKRMLAVGAQFTLLGEAAAPNDYMRPRIQLETHGTSIVVECASRAHNGAHVPRGGAARVTRGKHVGGSVVTDSAVTNADLALVGTVALQDGGRCSAFRVLSVTHADSRGTLTLPCPSPTGPPGSGVCMRILDKLGRCITEGAHNAATSPSPTAPTSASLSEPQGIETRPTIVPTKVVRRRSVTFRESAR